MKFFEASLGSSRLEDPADQEAVIHTARFLPSLYADMFAACRARWRCPMRLQDSVVV